MEESYYRSVTDRDEPGVFANTRQPNACTGQLAGIKFSHNLAQADSSINALNVGVSYRLNDALIPNPGIEW